MKILKAGTRVKTVIGGIDALVVGVVITMDLVEYKIRYFTNGEERISWLNRYEIEVSNPKSKVGFGVKKEEETNPNIILIEKQ